MNFEKTCGDIKLLNNLPSDSFGLDKMLKLMQDIMFDVHDETGKEFMDLPQNKDIISPWISIIGVLMNISFEDITAKLSERRREKISGLKKRYEEKLNFLKDAESEIDKLNLTERELNQKIADLENDYKNKLEIENHAITLQEKIKHLQTQIDNTDNYDIHTLEERLKEKELKLHNKNQEYTSVVNQNDCLRMKISEMEDKLESIKNEFDNLVQIHEQKNRELEICNENCERVRAKLEETEQKCINIKIDTDNLNEEINSHKLLADQLQSDYNEALKKNINEKDQIKQNQKELNIINDEIEKADQELKGIINKKSDAGQRLKEIELRKEELEKEINVLNNEYEECQKNRKAYESFFDSVEYKKKKKEIESCNIILELYRDGIHQLFKQDTDIEYLPDLSSELRQKEKVLTEQLDKAENILYNLKSEYITIIDRIESEVN